ncbi:DUF3052 domain-containing protein [Sporolactobacillus sp. THM7-4]|nr:DUF3052 domain-containing protein [Sporolactobacillus sp. THM7-4]
MSDIHPVIKKLQFKDHGEAVLVLHAPQAYKSVLNAFQGPVHQEVNQESYPFAQVFGTSNDEIRALGRKAVKVITDDGLLWLCYPKKSSKKYKGTDCSRDTVAGLLADEGYKPVRQIAIDEDWSALRFRKASHIKTMVRHFAETEEGKKRTGK